jgi:hypothetical protein
MEDTISPLGSDDKPEEQPEELPADPFDPAALRLSQDFVGLSGVKKLITTVRAKKPNKQDFFRVHPSPDYRATVLMIHIKEDQEYFLVVPALAQALDGETVAKTVYTVINRQGVVSLWPVTLPPADGKDSDWWKSERDAAERAMVKWVRVKPNMSLGANEILEGPASMAEPEWPDLPYKELLRIAFDGRLVDRIDHPVVKRLRGLS